jgi:hypothetical protein
MSMKFLNLSVCQAEQGPVVAVIALCLPRRSSISILDRKKAAYADAQTVALLSAA